MVRPDGCRCDDLNNKSGSPNEPGNRARHRLDPRRYRTRVSLLIVAGYAVAFAVFGLAVSGPSESGPRSFEILTTRDALITDYFGIGGIGAAFLNAGLLTPSSRASSITSPVRR